MLLVSKFLKCKSSSTFKICLALSKVFDHWGISTFLLNFSIKPLNFCFTTGTDMHSGTLLYLGFTTGTYMQSLIFSIFRDSLAFCTEPVLASLANILYPPSTYGGGINDDSTGTPAICEAAANELKNFTLEDVEIKMGFKEVSQL